MVAFEELQSVIELVNISGMMYVMRGVDGWKFDDDMTALKGGFSSCFFELFAEC